MGSKIHNLKYSVAWNLFLLTTGSLVYIIGMNGIVIHQNFIPGGFYGLAMFIFYKTELLSPGGWYLLLNIPLFVLSWLFVSRRFLLYTMYTVVVMFLFSEIVSVNFNIQNQLYAAVAGGFICGAGSGILLRSVGSAGGIDVIAVILYKYFNVGVGRVYLLFNVFLFTMVMSQYGSDIFIASVILTYVMSGSLNYFMTLSNQRKIVYVISDQSRAIADEVTQKLKMGATFIQGKGAYSGQDKEILMTITNNLLLKRLEEAVFTIDENALFIVENTHDVIGSNFDKRKLY